MKRIDERYEEWLEIRNHGGGGIPDKYPKLTWFMEDLLGMSFYDDKAAAEFGFIFWLVMSSVYEHDTLELFKDEESYLMFVMVANFLNLKWMIDWGTSIRSPWFIYDQSPIRGEDEMTYLLKVFLSGEVREKFEEERTDDN